MKKIIILLMAGLYLSGTALAQGLNLKGRFIDKDYYPLKGAKVTLKGTNQSTTTDKKGNFHFENAPLTSDSLLVESTKKDRTISSLVTVRMDEQFIPKRFSWFAKAGVGVCLISDGIGVKKPSFHLGAGIDLKLSKHWSFQPALQFVYSNMWTETGMTVSAPDGYMYYAYYDVECKANTLELPLTFALKFYPKRNRGVIINMGPYVSYGLSGKAKLDSDGYSLEHENIPTETDLFGNRFGGGFAYGINWDINHILFGFTGRVGVISSDIDDARVGIMFEVGYRF
ncbi:outer membrane beta-barrel protein [uncultured Bacteroides sp.]|uniref:outer membrane beta-barrel protein n=1 Tax=uncultured Bacteroides sp. TaxID=162156 RepID=UPI0023C72A2D|nr:outer membrane beta-barrel protein [uncultured Bacteroides sp.]MDE5701912.1 outer membrane beta-barrel protein [Bacteroides sp.]